MALGVRCGQANSKGSIWSEKGSSSKLFHSATLSMS